MSPELEPQFLEVVDTSALEMRTAFSPLQAGVYGAGDLKVTVGAGHTVDVASGIGFVQGSSITDQGLYRARLDVAKNSGQFELGGLVTHDATNPRLDQIIARVLDHTHDGSGLRKWRLEVLTGTPTAGATLDNRTGAAVLPSSSLRLADVLVPATSGAVTIRDRRPWARGAYKRIVRNTGIAADNYTTTSTTSVIVDATNLNPRIECSGMPVHMTHTASFRNSVATGNTIFSFRMDGAAIDGEARVLANQTGEINAFVNMSGTWDIPAPTPGSHRFAPYWFVTAGEAVLFAGSLVPVEFTVKEILQPNASND